jgi:hypothetical protein
MVISEDQDRLISMVVLAAGPLFYTPDGKWSLDIHDAHFYQTRKEAYEPLGVLRQLIIDTGQNLSVEMRPVQLAVVQ